MNQPKSGYPHVQPAQYIPNQPPPQYTPNPVIMQPSTIPPPPGKSKNWNCNFISTILECKRMNFLFLSRFRVFVCSSCDACSPKSSSWTATSISCLLQLSCKCFNTYSIWSEHSNASVCIDFMHCWVRDIHTKWSINQWSLVSFNNYTF